MRTQPIGCKYETGMAFSKRRIPYSIGTEKLEKAKPAPRTSLPATDESKLTKDMETLYQQLLPSAESESRRAQFLSRLGDLLNQEWPDGKIEVKVFGSSGNLLCTSDSDGGCLNSLSPVVLSH
jgi:DNA polymerase sigma